MWALKERRSHKVLPYVDFIKKTERLTLSLI